MSDNFLTMQNKIDINRETTARYVAIRKPIYS